MSDEPESHNRNLLEAIEEEQGRNLSRLNDVVNRLLELRERLLGYEPPENRGDYDQDWPAGALVRIGERTQTEAGLIAEINALLTELANELGVPSDVLQSSGQSEHLHDADGYVHDGLPAFVQRARQQELERKHLEKARHPWSVR